MLDLSFENDIADSSRHLKGSPLDMGNASLTSMGDLRERQMVDDMSGLMDQLIASEE